MPAMWTKTDGPTLSELKPRNLCADSRVCYQFLQTHQAALCAQGVPICDGCCDVEEHGQRLLCDNLCCIPEAGAAGDLGLCQELINKADPDIVAPAWLRIKPLLVVIVLQLKTKH